MSKTAKVFHDAEQGTYEIFCPGCNASHVFHVEKPSPTGETWEFNGDMDRPTFRPDLRISTPGKRCHSFVTDGHFMFLDECDHRLRHQLDLLPEWQKLAE